METVTLKLEEIAGTLLAEVFQITEEEVLATKTDLANQVVGEKSKPVGFASEFEQKLFALMLKKTRRMKVMANADEEDLPEFETLKGDTSMLKDLTFSQIKKRLKLNGENVGVIKDFQIVTESEDCASCPIRGICPDVH